MLAGAAVPAEVAIDRYMAQGDHAGVLRMGGLDGIAMLAEFGFLYLQYYLMMLVAQRASPICASISSSICKSCRRVSSTAPVVPLVTRLTTDVDVINEMFAAGALTILMDVATLLGIIAIMPRSIGASPS